MINGKRIALVIPCLDEAAGLRKVLPRRPSEVDEVIVVDNNSNDDTAAVARAHGARVVWERRPGYGRSYQAGMRAVTADIVVTMDGDGQYDIADVPRLVRVFLDRSLDLLSTTRFPMEKGSMPFPRLVGNAVLTGVTWLLFGRALRDSQSGMWVLARRILEVVDASEPGMAYSEEFKLKALRKGLRVGEVHIRYRPRVGASKLLPLGDGWKNLCYLFRLRFQQTR